MWEKIPGPLPQFLVLQALSQGGSMLLSLLLVQVNCWVHYFSKLILLASWWKLRFLCPLSIFGFPHPSWRCIRNLSHTSTRLAYTIKMEFHRMWESGPWDYLFCATNRKLGGGWEHTQGIMIIMHRHGVDAQQSMNQHISLNKLIMQPTACNHISLNKLIMQPTACIILFHLQCTFGRSASTSPGNNTTALCVELRKKYISSLFCFARRCA